MLTNTDILTLGLIMFASGVAVGLGIAQHAIARWKERVRIIKN